MDLFSNRKTVCVPFLIACLLVGWNGVVDERLYALFRQVLLQLVTLRTEDREYVVDILCVVQTAGQRDERILDVLVIIACYLLTMTVVIIQMTQFHVKKCCL